MNRKFLLLSAGLLFIALNSYCQQWREGAWTDGGQILEVDSTWSNKMHFGGGTMHEGGSSMYCELIGPNKLKIFGDDDDFPAFGKHGWTLEYRKLGEFELMVAKNTSKSFDGFLLKIHNGLEDFYIKNMINYQLAGTYRVNGSQNTVTFYPNEQRVNWQGKDMKYEFKTEYDTPVEVISLGNHLYYYERKFRKLFLYETKDQDGDSYDKGLLLYTLLKTDTSEEKIPGVFGDYGFASRIPLTDDIVFSYSKEELKMIRNEIYARHGLIFSNPEVKKYFKSKSWYKPTQSDVFAQLSEIERLNIAQIKRAENRDDR